jgi:hypothetical protein
VLGGFGLGCGVLWVGAGESRTVGVVQEERRQRRGSWARFSSSLHFSWLGSGQGELGSTTAPSRSMATGAGRMATVILTVILGLLNFYLSSVRRNARKSFKFEFLKTFTLGGQHISQGFQRYFCCQEWFSFAEVYISKFGIVTVSDSKFGRSLGDFLI